MTTVSPCNCDQAKAWEERFLSCEKDARALRLALRFTRQHLQRLLDRVDGALTSLPIEDVGEVHTPEGLGGFTTGPEQT